MTFMPNYPTNLSIDVGIDPLDQNQTIQLCSEDSSSNSTISSVSGSDYDLLFNFITYGVLLNIIGVFGIIGNIISMIILSRPQMKSSINYLLIGLARCDTVLIITSILLFGLPSIYWFTGYLFTYNWRIQPIIAPVVYPVAMISQTVSVYLTLVVTLERFVAVCQPLRARSLCTCGRARLYMIIVLIFSILYNITRFWEVSIEQCIFPNKMLLVYRVQSSTLRNNMVYINVYIHWMYLVFMYGLPFAALAWFNTRIYMQVRRANKERQRLSRNQKREIGLATMLLCVVVVFLLCNLVALASNFLEAFRLETIDVLVETGNLMVTINSSVNFVIYVIFGEKFKRLFFKLFFPRGLRFCGTTFRGRDSPEQTHDDSFMSVNGDHHNSIRPLRRIKTSCGKSEKCIYAHACGRKAQSTRIPRTLPDPCVYYPAQNSRNSWEHTSTTNF